MLIGYARVSTIEQNAQLQIDELEKVGCAKIFQDGLWVTNAPYGATWLTKD